jgi:hypothetical protein
VPPEGPKYLLAVVLVALTTLAFFRGEPATDIDSSFVAANVLLLGAAFIELTFFGFSSISSRASVTSTNVRVVSCTRGIQRGRAVSNDFLRVRSGRNVGAVAQLRYVQDARQSKKMPTAPQIPPFAPLLVLRQ